MILYRWGGIAFEEAERDMRRLHGETLRDGENRLIVCEHPPVMTIGANETRDWGVATRRCGRGGSITVHSPGQSIFYFVFRVPRPARFYAYVVDAFSRLFAELHADIRYERKRPGFYIRNRKVASLGFRYERGVSLYGIAVNVDVDLAFHAQVPPCGLEDVVPTSLRAEGVRITQKALETKAVAYIAEVFGESVQTES
jgi:lipoyl(octanoyl) transferase